MKSLNIMKQKSLVFLIYLWRLSETFLNYSVFHFEIQSLRMLASKSSQHSFENFYLPFCLPQLLTLTKMEKKIMISNSMRSWYITLFKRIFIISQESLNLCLTSEPYHSNNCWKLSNHCSPSGPLKLGLKAGLWKSIVLSREEYFSDMEAEMETIIFCDYPWGWSKCKKGSLWIADNFLGWLIPRKLLLLLVTKMMVPQKV